MKYYTREELEKQWLEKYPNDLDYKVHAVGGYVETPKGFIWYLYYDL